MQHMLALTYKCWHLKMPNNHNIIFRNAIVKGFTNFINRLGFLNVHLYLGTRMPHLCRNVAVPAWITSRDLCVSSEALNTLTVAVMWTMPTCNY